MPIRVKKKVRTTKQVKVGSRVRDTTVMKTIKGLRFPGKTQVTLFGIKAAQ